jgi:hypothetical protein
MTNPALCGQAAAFRPREESPGICVGKRCIHEHKAGIEGEQGFWAMPGHVEPTQFIPPPAMASRLRPSTIA